MGHQNPGSGSQTSNHLDGARRPLCSGPGCVPSLAGVQRNGPRAMQDVRFAQNHEKGQTRPPPLRGGRMHSLWHRFGMDRRRSGHPVPH